MGARAFDALVEEAEGAPIEGWAFSWLEGHATEERPSWRYAERVVDRARTASKMADLQCGGGPDDRPAVPFADETFDLVTSRHPVRTWWGEIARVLRPGGTYLSQQVGPDSVRELSEAIMGPWPPGSDRDPEQARRDAEHAGLSVVDLRSERLRTVFFDVGAVVYFLRLVIWIVPGFTVSAYRSELRALHEQIERDGEFVAHASRFLIEATKPV